MSSSADSAQTDGMLSHGRRLAWFAGRFAALAASAAVAGAPPVLTPPPADFAPGFASVAHTDQIAGKTARVDVWGLRRTAGNGGPVNLVMGMVPKADAQIRIVPVARRAAASRGLYERAPCPGALAMINGSFFEGFGRHEHIQGLLRVGRRALRPISGRQQGGFLTTDGRSLRILPRAEAARAQAADNAVESSPILMLRGQSGMHRDDGAHADRVAAGLTDKGDVVLIGAFGERNDTVSLYEFETLAEGAAAANGLRLRDVIAMDGGPSAHLYLPRTDLFFGQTGPIFLTDVICLWVG